MTIRVGLVGYGLSGSVFHAPIISAIEDLDLAVVVSSKPEVVKKDYPSVSVVGTFDELLEHHDVDLIVITTPNTTHFESAKKAIKRHKHVVVEKPFTVTAAEADELVTLAENEGVLLSVYQNRRYDNDFLTIKEIVKDKLLGELATYEAHYDRFRPTVQDRWREKAIPGAGTLYDLGSHLIDQALVLFGTPNTVWAELAEQRPNAVTTDYFHLVLTYEHLQVILHSSSLVRQPGPRFQLHGTKGSFSKAGLDPQEDALRRGQRPYSPGWGADSKEWYGVLTTQLGNLTVQGRIETLPGRYQSYYEDLEKAISGKGNLPVSAREARDVIRVIECALESHRERRCVPFKER